MHNHRSIWTRWHRSPASALQQRSLCFIHTFYRSSYMLLRHGRQQNCCKTNYTLSSCVICNHISNAQVWRLLRCLLAFQLIRSSVFSSASFRSPGDTIQFLRPYPCSMDCSAWSAEALEVPERKTFYTPSILNLPTSDSIVLRNMQRTTEHATALWILQLEITYDPNNHECNNDDNDDDGCCGYDDD